MRSSLTAVCALHLIGNALILWLGYAWLSIPESNAAHLLWSLLIVLVFACSALWLHGTAFVYFRRAPESNLRHSAVVALRHLPALFALAVIVIVLYWLLTVVNGLLDQPAFQLASWLTMTIRKPVPPARILALFHGIVWLVQWLVLPAILVPTAAKVAAEGFGSIRRLIEKPSLLRSLTIFVLLLGAVWAPMRLLAWVPEMPNFAAEMGSFLLRAIIAYLMFAGFLLALERAISSGRPSLTQRRSSAIP
ncbi:MAG TPA: hypothetical protein VN737_11020 [Bryobacteraceae bacterium]|nr:hypothetical protein [Bryobacteraceae bacterium]